MKPIKKFLLGGLLSVGVQLAWTGCIGPGGGGGAYDEQGVWIEDGGWLDGGGRGWYGGRGGDAYVHPGGGRPEPRRDAHASGGGEHAAAGGGGHASGGDHSGGGDHAGGGGDRK
jgi:hypothetical protein